MQMKMQEAEKMNEINDLYENLQRQKREGEMRAMAGPLRRLRCEHGKPRKRQRARVRGTYISPRASVWPFEPTPEAHIASRSRQEVMCWPPPETTR